MSRTPAATLARLKLEYPDWSFTTPQPRRGGRPRYVAASHRQEVDAITPAQLEVRLIDATRDDVPRPVRLR